MTLIKDLPLTPNGGKYTINAKYLATVNQNDRLFAFFSDSTVPKSKLNLTPDQSQLIFSNDESLISKTIQVEVWNDIIEPINKGILPHISQTRPWVSLDLRSTTSSGFISISSINQLSEIQINSLLKDIENWKRPRYDLLDKLNQLEFDPPMNLNQCYFVKVKIDNFPSMLKSYVYQHINTGNLGLKDLEFVIIDELNNKLLLTVTDNLLDFLNINVGPNWNAKDLDRAIIDSINELANSRDQVYEMLILLNEICHGVYKWSYKCHSKQ